MSFIEWGVDFYTGLPTVDDQHRKLVALANRLSEIPRDGAQELEQAFTDLKAYVLEHFSLEERLMTESELDADHLRYHKHAHALFAAKVAELWNAHRNAETGSVEDTFEQMLAFLKTWILQHILHTDRQMAFKIHERLGAAAPHNMFTHF